MIGTMYEDARNVGMVEAKPVSRTCGSRPPKQRRRLYTAPTMDEYRALLESLHRARRLRPRDAGDDHLRGLDRHPTGRLFALQWGDVAEDGRSPISRSRKLRRQPRQAEERPGPGRPAACRPPAFWTTCRAIPTPSPFTSPRGNPLVRDAPHGWRAERVAADRPRLAGTTSATSPRPSSSRWGMSTSTSRQLATRTGAP